MRSTRGRLFIDALEARAVERALHEQSAPSGIFSTIVPIALLHAFVVS